MYRWAGFGLWSPEGFAVLKRLPSQLVFFANEATLSRLLGLCVCVLLYLCVAHATCSVLRRRSFLPQGRSFALQAVSVALALILVSCTLTVRHVKPLVSEAPTRHPLAALFVSSTSERTFDKTQRDIRLSADASFHPAEDELVERIQRRSNQHRLLQVIPDDEHRDTEKRCLSSSLNRLDRNSSIQQLCLGSLVNPRGGSSARTTFPAEMHRHTVCSASSMGLMPTGTIIR